MIPMKKEVATLGRRVIPVGKLLAAPTALILTVPGPIVVPLDRVTVTVLPETLLNSPLDLDIPVVTLMAAFLTVVPVVMVLLWAVMVPVR